MCLYTQVCSKCSDIIESIHLYMSLGSGIFFGSCANINLCFSFMAMHSSSNCSIKTPNHTSLWNISLESVFPEL